MKNTPTLEKAGIRNEDQAFENFYATLRPSIKMWDYFVNWEKVFRNSKEVKEGLSKLNSLLGSKDFDNDFLKLLESNPDVALAIPALIVRDGSNSKNFSIVQDISDLTKPDILFNFSEPAKSSEARMKALEFIKASGLIQLFKVGGVSNLIDYHLGVEAGLDSNGRKNRSGTSMESIVENFLEKELKGFKFIPQATPKEIKMQWGFEVPVDKSSRSYDFAISDGKTLVLMEVNFYSGGGSKLKATAGEYKDLYTMLSKAGITFVWVTDGEGWKTTRLPLRSAFEKIDYLWNLNWLSKGLLKEIFN